MTQEQKNDAIQSLQEIKKGFNTKIPIERIGIIYANLSTGWNVNNTDVSDVIALLISKVDSQIEELNTIIVDPITVEEPQ